MPPIVATSRPPSQLTRVHLPRRATGRRSGDRMFSTYLHYIPLLWMLGALIPGAALMLVKLALEKWPRGALINLVVLGWFAVGASQGAAAILSGISIGSTARGLGHLIGFGVIGWIFGGLAIAVGAAHHLSSPRVVRATAWLGFVVLMLAGCALAAKLSGAQDFRLWPTPLQLVLPSSPAVKFYTSTLVFQTEQTFREATTRLVLFFPYPTALGLGALAIAFIATLERHFWWRLFGVAGGVTGVLFSWSRIAIAALLVVGAVLIVLRLRPWVRFVVVGAALSGLVLAMAWSATDPGELLDRLGARVNDARSGSSSARELIYQKSWDGFLESPIIGHGWIGESVHPKEVLPIGSHSTIFGLLYTGGAATFACFVIAIVSTVAALLRRLLSTVPGEPARDRILVGLGLALSLVMYSPYEGLFNLTLPCIFLLTWIGACIAEPTSDPAALRHGIAARAPRFGRFRSTIETRGEPARSPPALAALPAAHRSGVFDAIRS